MMQFAVRNRLHFEERLYFPYVRVEVLTTSCKNDRIIAGFCKDVKQAI
jgi:hypothetical protein